MGDDQEEFYAAPPLVSLASFSPSISPSPRRLSSHFSESTRPVCTSRRLSWVSLQGRLVNAEEASSARAVGGGLGREEAVAWELFSPIHRILVVAVVAVAVADLKKSRQIWKLQRSVDLRDQVLLSMQQKLDDLCEQLNTMKDRTETGANISFAKNEEFWFCKDTKSNDTKFSGHGCSLCNQHQVLSNGSMDDSVRKLSSGDEMFNFKMPLINGAEQEERRMSDLSDWASSVTSAADIQLNTLAIEQDMYNLQRECGEKDAIIKELSAAVHKSDVAGSKRITELEDIIRRKNMIITKLKKDMVVLEQKVVHLTRLRRPSSNSTSTSNIKLPIMADNLIYDMDSSTSPSSSDSDSPVENRPRVLVTHEDQEIFPHQSDFAAKRTRRVVSTKTPISLSRPADKPPKLPPVSPLGENSMNQRLDSAVTLRPKQVVSTGDPKRIRKRIQPGLKETVPPKKWV